MSSSPGHRRPVRPRPQLRLCLEPAGRPSRLRRHRASLFCAYLASVQVEHGPQAARAWIRRCFAAVVAHDYPSWRATEAALDPLKDSDSPLFHLYEFFKRHGIEPKWTVAWKGDVGDKVFKAEVEFCNVRAAGSGRSVKLAKQNAAALALKVGVRLPSSCPSLSARRLCLCSAQAAADARPRPCRRCLENPPLGPRPTPSTPSGSSPTPRPGPSTRLSSDSPLLGILGTRCASRSAGASTSGEGTGEPRRASSACATPSLSRSSDCHVREPDGPA